MKTKAIFLSCVLGLGMTTATWAENSFVNLSTPDEEIERQLFVPSTPIEIDDNDSDLEAKGFGVESCVEVIEESKGFEEIVSDTPLDNMPKIAIKLHFSVNSSEIHAKDIDLLRKLANVFKGEKLSNAKIVIAGHTDSDGSCTYNTGLSYNRAQAVRNFLVFQGVAENHLTIRAFGENQPIASNAHSAGKAQNRRVEFIRVR